MRFPLFQAWKGTMAEAFEDDDLPDLTAEGEHRDVDHAVWSLLLGEETRMAAQTSWCSTAYRMAAVRACTWSLW